MGLIKALKSKIWFWTLCTSIFKLKDLCFLNSKHCAVCFHFEGFTHLKLFRSIDSSLLLFFFLFKKIWYRIIKLIVVIIEKVTFPLLKHVPFRFLWPFFNKRSHNIYNRCSRFETRVTCYKLFVKHSIKIYLFD